MKSKLLSASIKAALFGGAMIMSISAQAHVSYPKALYNDTGTNPAHVTTGANLTAPGTGTQTFTATSNVGWYAASTAGLAAATSQWNAVQLANSAAASPIAAANSHDDKFLYFDLAKESKVTFTVAANTTTSGQTGSGAYQPAFSIFSGLAPYLSHDGAVSTDSANHTIALDPNGFAPWSQFYGTPGTGLNGYNGSLWGQYTSDKSFSIGHDTTVVGGVGSPVTAYPNGDPVNGFDFTTLNLVGYATNDGQAFGDLSHTGSGVGGTTVTATFDLQPGAYSLVVGGNNQSLLSGYLNDLFATVGTGTILNSPGPGRSAAVSADRLTFGFNITTTVTAVPVPGAVWLFGSALAALTAVGRRKSSVNA